jgi:hypothetical protein
LLLALMARWFSRFTPAPTSAGCSFAVGAAGAEIAVRRR